MTRSAGAETNSRRVAGWTVAGLGLISAVVLLTVQVRVGDGDDRRACGSAFDTWVDNAGWQHWWAEDLAEPTETSTSALRRTRDCPGAVNRNILGAGLLGTAALAALVVGGEPWATRSDRGRPEAAERIRRLGSVTTAVGSALTLAGMGAIVLLVADADSTLFLYVDRPVVAVVGLIVLVPTLALVVIGRAVALLAANIDRPDGPDEPSS